MTTLHTLFAAAALLLATTARAEPEVATADTVVSSPGLAGGAEVCVRNDLSRSINVVTTWGVGDGWSSTWIAAGQTIKYRLLMDLSGHDQPQLTVRYREYAGGLAIATRQLYTSFSYGASPNCPWGPRYLFIGLNDGHLRDHVVLTPVYMGAEKN